MLDISILIPVLEVDVVEFVRASRAIVSSINSIKISISPVTLIEKGELAMYSRNLNFGCLNGSRVDVFMKIFSIILKVEDISLKLVDSSMN